MYVYRPNRGTEATIWCLHVPCHAILKGNLWAVDGRRKTEQFETKAYRTKNYRLAIASYQIFKFTNVCIFLYCGSLLVFQQGSFVFLSSTAWMFFRLCSSSALFIIRCFGITLCLAAASRLKECAGNLLNEETRIFPHDLRRDHRAASRSNNPHLIINKIQMRNRLHLLSEETTLK